MKTLMDQKKIREYLESIIIIEQLSGIKKYNFQVPVSSKNIIFIDKFNVSDSSISSYFLKLHYLESEYILSEYCEKKGYEVVLKTKIEEDFVQYLKKELS